MTKPSAVTTETVDEVLRGALAKALQGLTHGTVTLTIHDSKVVTIERLERTRLAPLK